MKRVPFKWTDFALMLAGAIVSIIIYLVVTGDYDVEGPFATTAVFAGVSFGTLPLIKRIHAREQAEKAAKASEVPVETDTPA